MSKGINLLGSGMQVPVITSSRKLKLLRAIALGGLFCTSGASVILFLLIALSPLPALQEQEKEAQLTLSQYHPDVAQLLLIHDRIKGSEELIAKRPEYDRILATIKDKMSGDLTVTDMTLKEGEIALTINSSSLESLNTFLNNLIRATESKEDFSKIILTNFSTNETTNTFGATINVQPL